MCPVPFAEYLNVRIAGHYSRLLKRSMFDDLLGGDSLATITTYLLDHPGYSPYIEQALDHHPEREGLEAGVAAYFTTYVSELYKMSDEYLREQYKIALYSFELRTLSTIIVNHMRHRNFQEMLGMVVPCGLFSLDTLRPVYESGSFSDVMHYLSAHHPLQSVIKKAYAEAKKDGPVINLVNQIEIKALEYIMFELLERDDKMLRTIYSLEIDRKNIIAALKTAWEGRRTPDTNSLSYARGGSVDFDYLNEIASAASTDEALELVESTPFNEAIEKGIIYYAETGFLHEMERFFEEVFVRKTQYYRRFDQSGAGSFIGYVWAHYVELTNLRLIINGIAFKTGAGQIRKGLIYV